MRTVVFLTLMGIYIWGVVEDNVPIRLSAAAVTIVVTVYWSRRNDRELVERVRAESGDLEALRVQAKLAEEMCRDSKVEAICQELEARHGPAEADRLRREMAEAIAKRPFVLRRLRWSRALAVGVPLFLVAAAVTAWLSQ